MSMIYTCKNEKKTHAWFFDIMRNLYNLTRLIVIGRPPFSSYMTTERQCLHYTFKKSFFFRLQIYQKSNIKQYKRSLIDSY